MKRVSMIKITVKGLLVLLTLIVVANASGQNARANFPVTGTVLDPSGSYTPGATVSLKQGANVQSRATTDDMGKFRLDGVREGSYTIEVQLEGFRTSVTPLRITARPPAALTINLALSELSSEINVAGDQAIEVSTEVAENRDVASANQDLLEQVPVFDQDYVNTMSMFLDAASVGTSGTQLIVDGMQVNAVGVSASAIQEVRINDNPYSAEFARPGRANIEVITRASAPEYHGTFNFTFRDYHLNARDPFAATRAPEQRRIYEGFLSGPILHSKSTSFLFSGTRQEEDYQSSVLATTLSGLLVENVPTPRRNTTISLRVSHQFGENHVVSWQYNDREISTGNRGAGGFVLPEAATNDADWEREIVYNDRLTISPHWLNQFQILIGKESDHVTSVTSAPKIVVPDSFTSGGAQIDHLDTENHIQMNEIMTWSSGKHFLKFGFNMPDWSRRGFDNYNNFGGTYYFSDLSNFANHTPYAYKQQQGSGHVVLWQKELGGFIQDEYRIRPNLSLSLGLRYNWQNYLGDNKDIAPRIAFAYSPAKNRRTVIRGGAGFFYDRTGANPLSDLLLYDGTRLRSVLITNPAYPNPFVNSGTIGTLPTDVVRLDPTVREPYTFQYSIGVERQVTKKTTVVITYNGTRGVGLFRSRDINAPLAPSYSTRPDATLGEIRQIESSGRQVGNSIEFTVRGQITRFVTGLAQYTLSRTENNTGGVTWFPANQYDLSTEWGRADFDQRHRLNLLESFKAGNFFTLGVGLTASSGRPYSLITGNDTYHTGLANARPAGVSRNSLAGPGNVNLDVRVSRDFMLSKTKKEKGPVSTVSIDAFNVMNHNNFTAIDGNESSPFFGKPIAGQPERRLQFTVRFKY
jgi:hypothetical protein